jgi:hypothetical protein
MMQYFNIKPFNAKVFRAVIGVLYNTLKQNLSVSSQKIDYYFGLVWRADTWK